MASNWYFVNFERSTWVYKLDNKTIYICIKVYSFHIDNIY